MSARKMTIPCCSSRSAREPKTRASNLRTYVQLQFVTRVLCYFCVLCLVFCLIRRAWRAPGTGKPAQQPRGIPPRGAFQTVPGAPLIVLYTASVHSCSEKSDACRSRHTATALPPDNAVRLIRKGGKESRLDLFDASCTPSRPVRKAQSSGVGCHVGSPLDLDAGSHAVGGKLLVVKVAHDLDSSRALHRLEVPR